MTQNNNDSEIIPDDTKAYLAHMKANITQYNNYNSNAFFTNYYNQDRFLTTKQYYSKITIEKYKKNKDKS